LGQGFPGERLILLYPQAHSPAAFVPEAAIPEPKAILWGDADFLFFYLFFDMADKKVLLAFAGEGVLL
jgi:hypothetical protein